jgi:hypothetical protein
VVIKAARQPLAPVARTRISSIRDVYYCLCGLHITSDIAIIGYTLSAVDLLQGAVKRKKNAIFPGNHSQGNHKREISCQLLLLQVINIMLTPSSNCAKGGTWLMHTAQDTFGRRVLWISNSIY